MAVTLYGLFIWHVIATHSLNLVPMATVCKVLDTQKGSFKFSHMKDCFFNLKWCLKSTMPKANAVQS